MAVDLEKLGLTQEEFNNLPKEEQDKLTSEQSQTGSPSPEDEKEKQIKGLLADLQETRRKLQEEKRAKEDLSLEIDALKQQFSELTETISSAKETSYESYSDDDVVTFKQAKPLVVKAIKENLNEAISPIMQKINFLEGRLLMISEREAENRYSPEKVGEELSYAKVIEEGLVPLLKEIPEYRNIIWRSPNPAETAYRLGLTHSKFQEIIKKQEAEKIVKKISEEKPKTGAGAGGGSVGFDLKSATISDLLKLSDKELDELSKQT